MRTPGLSSQHWEFSAPERVAGAIPLRQEEVFAWVCDRKFG